MKYQFKRNNPLNIRFSKSNDWVGQKGEDNGFCVFEHYKYGFRAARILVKNYSKKGINTISSIVRRWAPPSENDTRVYIDFVSRWMEHNGYEAFGVEFEDSRLDLGNEMVICDLLAAMTKFESGVSIRGRDIYWTLQEWIGFEDGDECFVKGV